MSNKYNACQVEAANREADSVWGIIECADDLDTSDYTDAPVSTDQVNDWYNNGLITGFEGFLLLTDRTI